MPSKYQMQTYGEMACIAYSLLGEHYEGQVLLEPMSEDEAADILLNWVWAEWDVPCNDRSAVKVLKDGPYRVSMFTMESALVAHEAESACNTCVIELRTDPL